MRWAGTWMVVLGALDFLLPRLGYDLRWFELLGPQRDLVAGALLGVGVVLLALAWRRKRRGRD